MRIAFVVSEFPVLSETAVLNQVTGLLERNHQVDIYTLYGIRNESKAHGDVAKYHLLNSTFSRKMRKNPSTTVLDKPWLAGKNRKKLQSYYKLTYFLDHSECWTEMGYAGRKYVETHHNLNKLNERLVQIYQQLLME